MGIVLVITNSQLHTIYMSSVIPDIQLETASLSTVILLQCDNKVDENTKVL